MKANELPINSFLQAPNVQFVIPVYQRNYDWSTNECKELLKDIISVEEQNRGTHFIGSIVFIYDGAYSTSEVKELVIIDGQQRLTTINILYVALYRFAKENNNVQAEMLYNMFLTNQYVQNESSKMKLKQTDNNSLAFNSILNGTESTFDSYSNVIENYTYFRTIINVDNFETIINGLKRLIFVEISLERGKDDPQRIFESLNSTGLDLSQSDLIRNYILMDLDPKEQITTFRQVWNPIENNARDLTKQKTLVSDFIRDFITLRTKKIPNKNKVYLEFKKLFTARDHDDYINDLEGMKSLSVHYKKFVNPSTVPNSSVRIELEHISKLEINVAYPFLLQVFEDAENGIIDNDELVKILKLIQSFTWRRFIIGLPTNALNKIFMSLYAEVDIDDYYDSVAIALMKKRGSGKFPTDQELKLALQTKDLYNTQPKNKNYMFEMLENFNNREFVDTSNENITIEHIFPQHPNDDWKDSMQNDEMFLFKENLLNTISNLTLSGNNGALSNKMFIEKKLMNVDDKEQGYKYSRLWLNDYLKTIEVWNEEKYNERFVIIYSRFLKIWSYPDVEIPVHENHVEQNIFNADSPTHKKLDYFIFQDSKIEENATAKMYFHVIKELYRINTQLLIDNNIVYVSRKRSDFRSPQELINGYFIEANMDSNNKFTNLKKLLTLFGLEEELRVKYLDLDDESSSSRYVIRNRFWKQLFLQISGTDLFSNSKPTKESWVNTATGVSGIFFGIAVTREDIRIEILMGSSDKDLNKKRFNKLKSNITITEKEFGDVLEWQELPDYKVSRVKYELKEVSLYDESDWQKMNEFVLTYLPKFEKVMRNELKKFT